MNIFLVVLQGNSAVPHELVVEKYPEHHQIRKGAWIVASDDDATCIAVRERLGIHAKSDFQPATGVIVKVDMVHGYANSSLWEKINAWREAQ